MELNDDFTFPIYFLTKHILLCQINEFGIKIYLQNNYKNEISIQFHVHYSIQIYQNRLDFFNFSKKFCKFNTALDNSYRLHGQ